MKSFIQRYCFFILAVAVLSFFQTTQTLQALDKPKIIFTGKYNDSILGLKIQFSENLRIEAEYNVGFGGVGEISASFPSVPAKLGVRIGGDSGIFIDAIPAIDNAVKNGVLPPDVKNIFETLIKLRPDSVFLLKTLSLFFTAVYNKKKGPGGAYPLPINVPFELNQLIVRLLNTVDVVGNASTISSVLLSHLPPVLHPAIKDFKIPNILDKDTNAEPTISFLTFLDKRVQDVIDINNRKFEFDSGYTAAMDVIDRNPDLRLSPYQAFKRLMAIAMRVRTVATTNVIPYVFNNLPTVGAQVLADFGDAGKTEMKTALGIFKDAKTAYAETKNAATVKSYTQARLVLAKAALKYVKSPIFPLPHEPETLKTFLIRELRKMIPQTPGFDKLEQIVGPIFGPLGIDLKSLTQEQKIAPPPVEQINESELSLEVQNSDLDSF